MWDAFKNVVVFCCVAPGFWFMRRLGILNYEGFFEAPHDLNKTRLSIFSTLVVAGIVAIILYPTPVLGVFYASQILFGALPTLLALVWMGGVVLGSLKGIVEAGASDRADARAAAARGPGHEGTKEPIPEYRHRAGSRAKVNDEAENTPDREASTKVRRRRKVVREDTPEREDTPVEEYSDEEGKDTSLDTSVDVPKPSSRRCAIM